MESPLREIRVLDLSRYAPGPFCTLVCAALGADVVKVEPPSTGDPLRELDPEAFRRLNAGKRSLALDLKTEAGRRIVHRLASRSDVLVEGFRPGVMQKLGFDYGRLKLAAPGLIYVSITGYGQSGPYRDRAGHDVNYMAAAGTLFGASAPSVLQVADFAAGGLFAVTALLAALVGRSRTGAGCHVDLAMQHGLLSLSLLATGEASDLLSGRYPNYSLYRSRDGGFVSVGALEPKFWEAFCEAIERPDLARRIDDPAARADIAKILAAEDRSTWEKRFAAVDACVEIVRGPEEAHAHPQAQHRGAGSLDFSLPFSPGALDLAPAPGLGEHTREIVLACGFSEEELRALRQGGAT